MFFGPEGKEPTAMSGQQPHQTDPVSVVFPILSDRPVRARIQGPGRRPTAGASAPRWLAALLILLAGAPFPSWFAAGTAQSPKTRDIHIEAYRYGFSPARIKANRGDRRGPPFATAIRARVFSSRIMIFTSPSLQATRWCRFSGSHTLTIPRR